jgi:hypothetical protein
VQPSKSRADTEGNPPPLGMGLPDLPDGRARRRGERRPCRAARRAGAPAEVQPGAELRADCERCFALCCVAPAFAVSPDFGLNKPAGRAAHT